MQSVVSFYVILFALSAARHIFDAYVCRRSRAFASNCNYLFEPLNFSYSWFAGAAACSDNWGPPHSLVMTAWTQLHTSPYALIVVTGRQASDLWTPLCEVFGITHQGIEHKPFDCEADALITTACGLWLFAKPGIFLLHDGFPGDTMLIELSFLF